MLNELSEDKYIQNSSCRNKNEEWNPSYTKRELLQCVLVYFIYNIIFNIIFNYNYIVK